MRTQTAIRWITITDLKEDHSADYLKMQPVIAPAVVLSLSCCIALGVVMLRLVVTESMNWTMRRGIAS